MGKNAERKGKKGRTRPSATSTRRRAVAALRFFYCGRGDTILVRASPGHWGLIDCNLTRRSGAYDWLPAFVKRYIPKLEFVCLTHPHLDHYRGMHSLLRQHFVKDGRPRFGQFWDSGVDHDLAFALAEALGKNIGLAELDALYEFVASFVDDESVQYWPVVPGLRMCVDFGDFNIVGLSPLPSRVKRFRRRKVEEISGLSLTERQAHLEEVNDLSTVLVFMHKKSPVNIVMGSDATADVWDEALDAWDSTAQLHRRQTREFACVKVSHHGAKGCHCDVLYEDYCAQDAIAVLSVGPGDPEHPDSGVVRRIAGRGIHIYATCTATRKGRRRRKAGSRSATLPLPGTPVYPKEPRPGYVFSDLEVRVSSSGELWVSVPG